MEFERLIASDLFIEGPTPARYWGDQWLRVAEKVLKGLNHQLTNRVSSLQAAMILLADEQSMDESFTSGMASEVARLHELMDLYRALTAESLAVPEAVRLQDLLPQAVRLHEHHSDLRHVACQVTGDPDTEPIVVRQSALLRCVLVLLASVAGNVRRSERAEPIVLEYQMRGDDVCLSMRGVCPKGQLLFSGEGSLLHAVRAALAHADGSAEGDIRRDPSGDVVEYELRLPSLSAVRRREEAANAEQQEAGSGR